MKSVIAYVKYSKDIYELRRYCEETNMILSHDAVDTVNILTGSDLAYDENEEGLVVCEALKQLKQMGWNEGMEIGLEQGIEQGIEQGMIEACFEFGIPRDETIKRIMKKFKMSEEAAIKKVEKYYR